jgi:hypothetical protein
MEYDEGGQAYAYDVNATRHAVGGDVDAAVDVVAVGAATAASGAVGFMRGKTLTFRFAVFLALEHAALLTLAMVKYCIPDTSKRSSKIKYWHSQKNTLLNKEINTALAR